ncbi:MAG: hypothetical protein BGO43_02390 [Gammaproteobacteria bacterium 39-13]|nr:ankyrin repeat domain-containing protein [Gammaproteobacteria bacterium]OJV91138.1 MAG: hypothetical protein BGO43_02390 [Gammaproteobacteria bacterium 39-13]
MLEPDLNQRPIVIAGMGPAGLASAIELAKMGHSLVVIEPRESFSRIMEVKIDAGTFQFLLDLRDRNDPLDQEFFEKKLRREPDAQEIRCIAQLKDIQTFLIRKLQHLSEKNKKSQKIRILRGGYNITEIDPSNQILKLYDKQKGLHEEIYFRDFIAADGAKHSSVALLNETQPDHKKIHYNKMNYQPRQGASGTVSLHLKKGVPVRRGNYKFEPKHFARLQELGWDKPYFPRFYTFSNNPDAKKRLRYFISGEIPDRILQMSDQHLQREALEEWGQFLMFVRYGYHKDDLKIVAKNVERKEPERERKVREKNKLVSTAFNLELYCADQSAVTLGQGGAFILAGDNYKNANFFYVHGTDDAVKDAKEIAENFRKNKQHSFDVDDYDQYQKKQVAQLNLWMKQDKKKFHEGEMQDKLHKDLKAVAHFLKKMDNPRYEELSKEIRALRKTKMTEQKIYFKIYQNMNKLFDFIEGDLKKIQPNTTKGKEKEFTDENQDLQQLHSLKEKVFSHFRDFFTLKETNRLLSHYENKELISLDLFSKLNANKLHQVDDHGRTIVMHAIMMGVESELLLKILKRDKHIINHQDANGNTALTYAILNNREDIVSVLLSYGAKVDDKTRTLAKSYPAIAVLLPKEQEQEQQQEKKRGSERKEILPAHRTHRSLQKEGLKHPLSAQHKPHSTKKKTK